MRTYSILSLPDSDWIVTGEDPNQRTAAKCHANNALARELVAQANAALVLRDALRSVLRIINEDDTAREERIRTALFNADTIGARQCPRCTRFIVDGFLGTECPDCSIDLGREDGRIREHHEEPNESTGGI